MVGARPGAVVPARRLSAGGLALAVLAAVALSASGGGVSVASASSLEPCPKPPPAPRFDGEGVLVTATGVKKLLGKRGVRQKLLSPANSFTGRPTYPLGNASLGKKVSKVSLSGGLRLNSRRGSRVRISSMKLVVRKNSRPVVSAMVAGRRVRLFRIGGARARVNLGSGVLSLRGGSARLSASASKLIRRRLGLRGAERLSTGRQWGRISVYAARNNEIKEPEAEVPVEPPFLGRPNDSSDITSASVKWRVRESFIRYVAVGSGTSVAGGATADPPEAIGGATPLAYSFNFPFSDGWISPDQDQAAIHGTGKVGFRYCSNTINFTVADPEIELNGDSDSRLIFRVDGTDGTAFPDSRAVMVQLIPSRATSRTTEGNTTTYTDIPGYIPQAATGIFADFYPPFPGSADAPGAELSRFGSLTVSFTAG